MHYKLKVNNNFGAYKNNPNKMSVQIPMTSVNKSQVLVKMRILIDTCLSKITTKMHLSHRQYLPIADDYYFCNKTKQTTVQI